MSQIKQENVEASILLEATTDSINATVDYKSEQALLELVVILLTKENILTLVRENTAAYLERNNQSNLIQSTLSKIDTVAEYLEKVAQTQQDVDGDNDIPVIDPEFAFRSINMSSNEG